MAGDREQRRVTFDSAADLYQQARPEYPEQLFDELAGMAGLEAGDRLLEIGCATGKATAPLARRGFRVTCIEIGPRLAAAARRNLAGHPNVHVTEGAFETWQSPPEDRFDLVFAATAWHWIDPAVRYRRAWELLRPGGHLAFWSATHVFPEGGDPFFAELQEVYDEIAEGPPGGVTRPRPDELPDSRAEITGSGYLRLLDTFSDHIAMQAGQRDRLHAEIRRRLARRPDGRLRRHWGAVLHVARRRDRG